MSLIEDTRNLMVGGSTVLLNRYTFAIAEGASNKDRYMPNQPWYNKAAAYLSGIRLMLHIAIEGDDEVIYLLSKTKERDYVASLTTVLDDSLDSIEKIMRFPSIYIYDGKKIALTAPKGTPIMDYKEIAKKLEEIVRKFAEDNK